MTTASSTHPDPADPKGLVREAYRIDGIGGAECRSILIDWALSLPAGQNTQDALRSLLARYGSEAGHPMTEVLQEGLEGAPAPRRRGGRSGRVPQDG